MSTSRTTAVEPTPSTTRAALDEIRYRWRRCRRRGAVLPSAVGGYYFAKDGSQRSLPQTVALLRPAIDATDLTELERCPLVKSYGLHSYPRTCPRDSSVPSPTHVGEAVSEPCEPDHPVM